VISTYSGLLRTPGAWRFLSPALVARLPYAMLGLGIILLVRHTTGSYGTAGAVSAVAAVSLALAGPQTGRLADRFGQAAVIVPGAIVHGVVVTAFIISALSGAPLWLLFILAALAGASVPQIGSMVRARWVNRLQGDPKLSTAFAFESVTDEFTFVVGPVLAAFLATGVHPAAGLAVEAALTVGGSLFFAAQRASAPAPVVRAAGEAAPASALRVPGVKLLVVAFMTIGAVFGSIQVSITAFAEEAGRAGLSGALYGAFATGSLISGAVYGAVAWKSPARHRLMVSFGLLVVGTSPLWAVGSVGLMAPIALLCGLTVAPALITGFTLVDTLVPASAKTEAFTWLTGAIGLGLAAGSTLAGTVADARGAGQAFWLTFGAALVGLATVSVGQRWLKPVPKPSRDVTCHPVVDAPRRDEASLALGR
jgi:MFS family permease